MNREHWPQITVFTSNGWVTGSVDDEARDAIRVAEAVVAPLLKEVG